MGAVSQNMTGVATGLALCGQIIFTYSIANFPTLRCLEQIRNDLCYHNANVKIVAVGGGLAYGAQGYTHHGVEDLAIMRALPNMKVLCPADPAEAALATRAAIAVEGPVYTRLGKSREPRIYLAPLAFEIGKAITVRDGTDVTLIATGGLVYNALLAGQELSKEGISARVISMHTIKPLDEEAILNASHETRAVFTIEEHTIVGGLGSAVAEVLAERGNRSTLFRRIGVRDSLCHQVGSQEFLRRQSGLSADEIAHALKRWLSGTTTMS